MFKEIFKKKKVAKNILGHPKIGTFSEKNWSFFKSPTLHIRLRREKKYNRIIFLPKTCLHCLRKNWHPARPFMLLYSTDIL